MEPPLKRIRISKDGSAALPANTSLSRDTRPLPTPAAVEEQPLQLSSPTRTLSLDAFRRRSQLNPLNKKRALLVPHNAGIALSPRAPDATVTASVVEIAINDNSAITQVTVPTDPTAVALPNLGTVTVSGVDSITSDSKSHLATSTVSSSDDTSSTLISGGNSTITSSSEHTATITATSTLHLSYKNGTFIFHSATHNSTAFATDVSTTYDSSTSSTSAYVFGDGVTYTPSSSTSYNGATANGIASTTASSSSNSSPSSNSTVNGPVLTQQQAQVVGGVVGSVAGVALVLVILLYVLRWYRQRLKCQGRLPEQLSSGRDLGNTNQAQDMVFSQSRQSMFSISPFAQGLKKYRPNSQYTVATSTKSIPAADSEMGFQKIAGRKIPSVLSEGGDGFGGNFGVFEKEVTSSPPRRSLHEHGLSRTSFYRDSGGIYATKSRPASASFSEPGTPSSSSFSHPMAIRMHRAPSFSTLGTNTSSRDFAAYPANLSNIASAFAENSRKPDGYAMMRSSPARTPVTQSPSARHTNFPMVMHASVTMDEDVPEMPLTPPPIGLGLRPGTDRKNSQFSVRSGSSAGGKFKENI